MIAGTPGSVVFVASRGRAVALGVTRQLIGDTRFGAAGFRWCGNVIAPAHDPQFDRRRVLVDAAHELAGIVSAAFGLVGLNGIDFIARDGEPVPIEVNPRWSASMELVERAGHSDALFAVHAAACARDELPSTPIAPPRRAIGKAVVFARTAVDVPDTTAWLADPTIADVPRPGSHIDAGAPICTVFAEAVTGAACETALARRAADVYAAVERPAPARLTA
jgi:predicted ATP-grasp superfamily ATP-dependent carboligase